ncbi:MAG: tetratricopeptide repeat protein [Gemmatimonadaceae bacterium]
MKRRSSYKTTFFDRHGPEGGNRLKAYSYGMMVAALVFSATLLASAAGGAPIRGMAIVWTLLVAATLGCLVSWATLQLGTAAGNVAQLVTAGGSSTPYEEAFSQEQALVMQRDYAGALACYEQRIAHAPDEPRCRVAAAELYATHGQNPQRAAELFREVQRIPNVPPGQDVYVSNRLADLYLGALKQPGRALVEFRRLIERYPNSRTADQCRMALANLKSDMVNER